MIIDKNNIRYYTDEKNNIFKASIMDFSNEVRNLLEQNHNEIKILNIESPYCLIDFSLLEKMKNLEELQIDARYKVYDVTFVNKLKNLKIFCSGKITGTLNLKSLTSIAYKWHKKSDISLCSNVTYIVVSNCTDINLFLSQISKIPKLQKLKFIRISNSAFPKSDLVTSIKDLEFSYCPNLKDLNELFSIFPNLTKIRFDHCKNIVDYNPISNLKQLKEIVILESAELNDLKFLKDMDKLTYLKIGKTKITSKNIEILDEISAKTDLLFTGI